MVGKLIRSGACWDAREQNKGRSAN